MFLFKHPDEIPQNKKMEKVLIERWSRLIFGLSDSYKDLANRDDYETTPKRSRENPSPVIQRKNVDLDLEEELSRQVSNSKAKDLTFHARIPEKMTFDFTVLPRSTVELPKKKMKQKTKLERQLQTIKTKYKTKITRDKNLV